MVVALRRDKAFIGSYQKRIDEFLSTPSMLSFISAIRICRYARKELGTMDLGVDFLSLQLGKRAVDFFGAHTRIVWLVIGMVVLKMVRVYARGVVSGRLSSDALPITEEERSLLEWALGEKIAIAYQRV
jgi:hypothetical protein